MAPPYNPGDKRMYFTLQNGHDAGTAHTCGDTIRATLHLQPRGEESLSVSDICVKFKCKVRTAITTGGGNNQTTHRSSIYLYCFSTPIPIGSQGSITVNSRQSWDVEFQFPWTVLPHPTQTDCRPHPAFPHEAGHRLPPTWSRLCNSNTQSVHYYLEWTMTRKGRLIDHNNKDRLPLVFCPPLDIPSPEQFPLSGPKAVIWRESRLLDPAKRGDHYGFREKTKDFFSSSNQNPNARFNVTASAPTVCCMIDSLPVKLHLEYREDLSTAPERPEVTIRSLQVRLDDFVQYRVQRKWGGELVRTSSNKVDVAKKIFSPREVVYDAMNLNDLVPLDILRGPSFATFNVNRTYMLKISATFSCSGKDFDLVIYRNELTIHPARIMYRPFPGSHPQGEAPMPSGSAPTCEARAAPPPYESKNDDW